MTIIKMWSVHIHGNLTSIWFQNQIWGRKSPLLHFSSGPKNLNHVVWVLQANSKKQIYLLFLRSWKLETMCSNSWLIVSRVNISAKKKWIANQNSYVIPLKVNQANEDGRNVSGTCCAIMSLCLYVCCCFCFCWEACFGRPKTETLIEDMNEKSKNMFLPK